MIKITILFTLNKNVNNIDNSAKVKYDYIVV